MSQESKTLSLKDGRDLGYGEWGDLDGLPIFFFHGTPGSRILTQVFDDVAGEKGVRLIGTDRPGFGLSTLQEDRTIRDYPNDIVELADHLGLKTFGVMGASGGGPFVMACAHQLPDQVFGGLAISAIGPREAMADATRQMIETNVQNPEATEQQLAAIPEMARSDRDGLRKMLLDGISDKYRALAETKHDQLDAFIDHYAEGQRQGGRATLVELQLFLEPWGFELEDINVPVAIWCGDQDLLLQDCRYMAEKLPKSQLTVEEGAGHIDSIWMTGELLDMLLALAPSRVD